MATRKKTTANSKRFLTKAELAKIGKLWYPLTRCVYDLTESTALNSTAKKEIKAFYKGLEKARRSISIARASGFTSDSF